MSDARTKKLLRQIKKTIPKVVKTVEPSRITKDNLKSIVKSRRRIARELEESGIVDIYSQVL